MKFMSVMLCLCWVAAIFLMRTTGEMDGVLYASILTLAVVAQARRREHNTRN